MARVIARMHSEYTHAPSGVIFTRENVIIDGLSLQVAVATVPDAIAREHFMAGHFLTTFDEPSDDAAPGAALPPSPAPAAPPLPEPGEPDTAAGASEDAPAPRATNRRYVRGK